MRITSILSAAVIAIVVSFAAIWMANPAFASVGTGAQWSGNGNGDFINGWNGGPDVNVYNSQAANNDFSEIVLNGANALDLTNGTSSGLCIGDLGNNQYSARAGLSACNSVPWGSRFTTFDCTTSNGLEGMEFQDIHWDAWLSGSGSNGSPFYLNTGTATCYAPINPF